MSQRPDVLRVSLGDETARRKAALVALAEALDLGGNISKLTRLLADIADSAPEETATLLKAAHRRAAGGNEWQTLADVRELLPPVALAVAQTALLAVIQADEGETNHGNETISVSSDIH